MVNLAPKSVGVRTRPRAVDIEIVAEFVRNFVTEFVSREVVTLGVDEWDTLLFVVVILFDIQIYKIVVRRVQ